MTYLFKIHENSYKIEYVKVCYLSHKFDRVTDDLHHNSSVSELVFGKKYTTAGTD